MSHAGRIFHGLVREHTGCALVKEQCRQECSRIGPLFSAEKCTVRSTRMNVPLAGEGGEPDIMVPWYGEGTMDCSS